MYLQIKVGYFGFCHAPKSTYIVCENDTPFPNLILPVHIKQAERKIDIYFIRKIFCKFKQFISFFINLIQFKKVLLTVSSKI